MMDTHNMRVLSYQTIVNDESLSLLQKILLTTDGTVTELLTLYTGEMIRVKKIEQAVTRDGAPSELKVPRETSLLKRKILLSGATKSYLFAESCFVFEQLSKSLQYKLLETDQPIGMLWKEERIEIYREVIDYKIVPCEAISSFFNLQSHIPILSRTCLIFNSGKPFGIITESFPSTYFRCSSEDFVDNQIVTTAEKLMT